MKYLNFIFLTHYVADKLYYKDIPNSRKEEGTELI